MPTEPPAGGDRSKGGLPAPSDPAERRADPLVGELQSAHRRRLVLVVAAVILIVAVAAVGTLFALDVFGDAARGTAGSTPPP